MSRNFPRVLILATLLLLSGEARAIVVDWDTATWTNGSTTGSVSGVDFNITASNPGLFTGSLVAGNPPTPAVTRAFDGGLSPGQKTLELALNLPAGGNGDFVTTTFTFNAVTYVGGVANVSFKLFDIDMVNDPANGNTYQDRLFNIIATTTTGATITPTITLLGSTVTNTGGVLTGNASAVDTGVGSGAGNVQIDFGGAAIRSVSFSYGSTALFADPTYQHVGLYDISFTPVPEVNPAWTAVGSCGFAAFAALWHRRKVRNAQRSALLTRSRI